MQVWCASWSFWHVGSTRWHQLLRAPCAMLKLTGCRLYGGWCHIALFRAAHAAPSAAVPGHMREWVHSRVGVRRADAEVH